MFYVTTLWSISDGIGAGVTSPTSRLHHAATPLHGLARFTFLLGAFSTAITAACVTGVADNDTTGAGANECIVNIGFA